MKPAITLAALSLLSACATLPSPPPHTWVEPGANPPPKLELCWLEVGGRNYPGSHGTAGWTRASTWEATASALLIRHPSGDVLVDTGVSSTERTDRDELRPWNRFLAGQLYGSFEVRGDLLELLRRAGVAPERLRAVILSHAHPDHAGGIPRLPGVPVLVGPGEPEYVAHTTGGWTAPPQAEALNAAMTEVRWQPRPWANFDESFDVFGDGSVVLVPLPGHTPGSLGTFVSLADGTRVLHVGDIISLGESIDREVPKSKLVSLITDEDRDATRQMVAKLVQLARVDPSLTVLPAHDRTVWTSLFGERAVDSQGPWCRTAGAPALDARP